MEALRRLPGDNPHLNPKQWAFTMLDDEEALYGGAAGGGKSVALLIDALKYADRWGCSGLLIHRTFEMLTKPKALLDLAKTCLMGNNGISYNQTKHTFHFPEGGPLLFGYLARHDELQ